MKIHQTRNYSLFVSSGDNRPITERDHKILRKLETSMRSYGFLPFPILVKRVGDKLTILDGQHRLYVAQKLALPIFYAETDRDDINIAVTAASQCPWRIFDYVNTFAKQGSVEYLKLIEFQRNTELPLVACANLLQGSMAGGGSIMGNIKSGKFRVVDLAYAKRVANLVAAVRKFQSWATNASSIAALSRFCRVPDFSDEILLQKIEQFPQLLKITSSTEDFSEMYEGVYNHHSHKRIPLAFMAREAMALRNRAKAKKRLAAEAKQAAAAAA